MGRICRAKLVMAVEAGQTTIVKYLLKQGASLCFKENEFRRDAGYKPLAEAHQTQLPE